jgi:hypothetical protein
VLWVFFKIKLKKKKSEIYKQQKNTRGCSDKKNLQKKINFSLQKKKQNKTKNPKQIFVSSKKC